MLAGRGLDRCQRVKKLLVIAKSNLPLPSEFLTIANRKTACSDVKIYNSWLSILLTSLDSLSQTMNIAIKNINLLLWKG